MQKVKSAIVLFIVLILLLTGCKNKEEPISNVDESTIEETQEIDPKVNESQDNVLEKKGSVEETEIIHDEETKPISKFCLEDFDEVSELPKEQIFEDNVLIPDGFNIQDVVIKRQGSIQWNHGGFLCSFQLLVGNDNQAIFSFGNIGNGQADESFMLKSKNTLKTGYLGWDNRVLLLSFDEETGKLNFDCYDYYGKEVADYQFDDYDGASNFQIIASDMYSFYLVYKKDGKLLIDTYSFKKDGLSFVNKDKFKEGVVNVYGDENTLFVEYENNGCHYIDICNKSFAVMDLIEIESDMEIIRFEYILNRDECNLYLYAKMNGKLYSTGIPIKNLYSQLHTYTVLENQVSEYNAKHEHHFLVDDGYWFYDNGVKVKSNRLLDGNYKGINYFQMINRDIVKTNSEYDVCYLLEGAYNNITKFIKIDDYYVGLNGKDEVCYIDKDYMDRPINDTFMGEKISSQNIYFDTNTKSVTYINKEERAVYTITKEHQKILDVIIPDSIWEAYHKEDNNYFKMGYDEKGIGLISDTKLYYYDRLDASWHTIEANYGIQYDTNHGYTYEEEGILLNFNPKTHAFEPYYINKAEVYNTMVVDDLLYVNTWYDDNCQDDPYHELLDSEYVTLKTPYGDYRLSDYQTTQSHKVLKEYSTNQLLSLSEEGWKNIINEPVRLFTLSEDGILYTGYEERSYLYYYDFETASTVTLFDETFVADLALIKNYAYFIPIHGSKLIRIHLQTNMIEEVEVENPELAFEASTDYIAVGTKDNELIYIIDASQFRVIDIIDGDDFKWSENVLFYNCNGYLVKYNPLMKEMIIMNNIVYPVVQAVHKEQVYYLWCYDGPPDLGMTPVEQVMQFSDEAIGSKDYYLLNNQTHYYAHLLLYDNNKKRLQVLGNADRISYKVEGNVIKIQEKSYNGTEECKEVEIEEGATIGFDGVLFD